MISLQGVSKSYPKQTSDRPALNDVSLSIEPGEMIAVVGPNGAGKSTLLGLLSGILSPDIGTVVGKPKRAVVLQKVALDTLLTVRENATVFARVYGVKPSEREQRLVAVAESAGLSDRLDDRVATLSGGLARRADLLRATMVGPELLILDEPTAGLDRTARPEIMAMLDTLRIEYKMAMVVVTHDLEEAACADQIIMLDQGQIVCQGTPESLIETLGDTSVICVDLSHAHVLMECGLSLHKSGMQATAFVPRDELESTTKRLIESEAPYSNRKVSLVDVYDRVVGGKA